MNERIYIAIPAYRGQVHVQVLTALCVLLTGTTGREFHIDHIDLSTLTRARNMLALRFMESGFDWLLFWDSDVVPGDPFFLEMMLETSDTLSADIVSAVCRVRDSSGALNCARIAPGSHGLRKIEHYRDPPAPQFVVDAAGTGLMLIHRRALETIPEPWFECVDLPGGLYTGEDFLFCFKAAKSGVRVAAEARFATTHFGAVGLEYAPRLYETTSYEEAHK